MSSSMMLIAYVDGATRPVQGDWVAKKSTVPPHIELEEVARRYPTRGAVGRNLAALMASNGDMNQPELARRSGVSQRHISDILRGRTDATGAYLDKLAAVFGREGWQLAIDGLHEEILASSGNLGRLVSAYVSDPRVRALLDSALALAHPPKNLKRS